MGAVSGMLGLAGGAGGTGFAGPKTATIQSPATTKQANTAYDQNQQALQQQQSLVQALAAQNGLGNQSNVYNQLQGVANGTGPNPAQAQLAQATGANTANQAALMAGQRGAGANPALIARQAAMQGAANQQNAAGQAATLQAQQSLGAIGQMGGIANQQAGQQIGATQNVTAAQQQEQQQLLNQISAQNNANVGMQSNINTANAGMAQTSMGNQAGAIGGLANSAGHALGSLFAEGGEVGPKSFMGRFLAGNDAQAASSDMLKQQAPMAPQNPQQKLQSGFESLGNGMVSAIGGAMKSAPPMPAPGVGGVGMMAMAAEGGKVPALVSRGEQYLDPKDVQKVARGADPLAVGERIPGKPAYPGNDYRNDVVPKTLEEGGIVIPNAIMQSKNPHWEAMKFVHAHVAKTKGKLPKGK